MRNEYTGLRKWDNWGAMFLVLCVFAIDTGLGNVYKVVGKLLITLSVASVYLNCTAKSIDVAAAVVTAAVMVTL